MPPSTSHLPGDSEYDSKKSKEKQSLKKKKNHTFRHRKTVITSKKMGKKREKYYLRASPNQ